MAAVQGQLAILGVTGYTGRLVCAHARAAGMPLRLLGRRREALEALAEEREEIRLVDAKDESALRQALEGAAVVISLAGPFAETGTAPVSAAVAAGAHYVDSSGEQSFARRVYEGFDGLARERGVALLTSFGFDYVPGDLAARIAAEGLEEPLEEIVVAYAVSRLVPSSGTLRTVAALATQEQVAYDDGLVASRFGATTRRVTFPFGPRAVVEWGGTEPLTVPRHTRVRRVRSYVRAPHFAARAPWLARAVAPAARFGAGLGLDPPEALRRRSRFAVVAEARGGGRSRRATLTGTDVYGLTASLLVRAAEALRGGEIGRVGALAPAQAFDARLLVDRLQPLLRVESVEEL